MSSVDDTLVTWPPPGLDSLHGALLIVRSRVIGATLLIAPPLVWVVLGMPVDDRPIRTSLILLLVLGLVLFLSAILNAARVLDVARRARRLGYPASLLLEVAVDRARDTAAVLAGTGPYESVRPRTRDRVRQLRVLAQVLSIAAAVLPLPLICIALPLALRGAADGLAVALIPLLPVLFFTLTSAIASGYAAVLAQWDRGSDAWDPSPVTVEESAVEWQTLAGVAPRPRRAGGLLMVLAGAAAGVALFISVAFTLAVVTGWAIAIPQLQSRMDYMSAYIDPIQVELMREWRLPVDSSITRLQAGAALHSLIRGVSSRRQIGNAPATVTYARPFWPERLDYYWAQEFFKYATGDKRVPAPRDVNENLGAVDSLAKLGPHPMLRELHTLAHASDIDITSTRYVLPLVDTILNHDAYSYGGARPFQAAVVTQAMQRYRTGDIAGAELLLRELISAGFLLIDRAPFQRDFSNGGLWIGAGRDALITLYHATGRPELADGLARVQEARNRAIAASGGMGGIYDYRSLPSYGSGRLGGLFGTVKNASTYPAVRWNAFQAVVPMARCGSLQSAMFGPDAYTNLLIDNSVAYLVRIPSDSVLTRAVLEPPHSFRPDRVMRSGSRGFRRLQRAVLFVIGEHQLTGPCVGAFTARF